MKCKKMCLKKFFFNNNRLVIQIYRINTILYIFCILDFLKKLQNSNPYKIYGIIIWN